MRIIPLLLLGACGSDPSNAPPPDTDAAVPAADATTDGASPMDAQALESGTDSSGDAGYPLWSCLSPYATPASRDVAYWPFASDSPWNTPMGSGATFEPATGLCTHDLQNDPSAPDVASHQWSQPVYIATGSDPTMSLYQGGVLQVSNVHVPAGATPALPLGGGTDGNINVVDPPHTVVDELWQATKVSGGWDSNGYARNDLKGPGCTKGGIRAYGGSTLAGLIRSGELKSQIRHALAFAIDTSQQKNAWVWPAISNDGHPPSQYTGHMPMGQLVGIPPDVDLCKLGLSAGGLAFARAVQDYGAYLTDSSGGVSFVAEPRVEDDASAGEVKLLGDARNDLSKILGQARCVTNNSSSAVGGGGARRAPAAP
jgi:hypothetical protein